MQAFLDKPIREESPPKSQVEVKKQGTTTSSGSEQVNISQVKVEEKKAASINVNAEKEQKSQVSTGPQPAQEKKPAEKKPVDQAKVNHMMNLIGKRSVLNLEDQIRQQIVEKNELLRQQVLDIEDLTKKLELQKFRNETFHKQGYYSKIIALIIILICLIHGASFASKHWKSTKQV